MSETKEKPAAKKAAAASPVMEMIPISSPDVARAAIGEQYIKAMQDAVAQVRAVEIKDASSLTIARGMGVALNKTIKAIEEKVKTLRKPYGEAYDQLGKVRDTIIGDGKNAVEELKKKMTDYEAEALKAAEEIRIKAQLEAEATIKNANAQADETKKIAGRVADWERVAMNTFTEAKTMEELKEAHVAYVNPGVDGEDSWKEIKDHELVYNMRQRLIAFKNMRKEAIAQIANINTGNAELDELEKKKALIKSQAAALEAEEAAIKQRIADQQRIEEENKRKADMAKAQENSQIVDSEVNIPNMREVISWELDDFSKVPEAWKMVNVDMVKTFIKDNKAQIANGAVVNGIRFIIDRKPAL
jgi:hypothetical protein